MQMTFVLEMDFGAQGSDVQQIYAAPYYINLTGTEQDPLIDNVDLYDPAVIIIPEVCA